MSGVDESGIEAETPAALTAELARLKAEAVDATLALDGRTTVLVGCDSMLELDGQAYGKPAPRRWRSSGGGGCADRTGC